MKTKTVIQGVVEGISSHFKLVSVLIVYVVISCFYIKDLHQTADDGPYFSYAARWIKGHPERISIFDDSKTPMVALSLIPRIIKQLREPTYKASDFGASDIKAGRYFMLTFSILTGLYLYFFLQNVFRVRCRLLPVIFFLSDPLIMGYAPVIGSDIASGLFTMATLYYCCRYLETRARKYITGASLAIGLGLVNKVSSVFALLIITGFFVLVFIRRGQLSTKRGVLKLLKTGSSCCIIVLLVINTAYYFSGTGFRLRDKEYASKEMTTLASIPFINSIPVPLPYPYVQSYDLLSRNKEFGGCKSGSSYDGVFIAGQYNENGPIFYYYGVCLLYKVPLSFFVLCIVAVYVGFRRKIFARFKEIHVLITAVVTGMFFILSFFNHFQTGIRHLLIIYPLLYLFAGRGLDLLMAQSGRYGKPLIAAAGLFQLVSLGFYFPNLIGYTNELLWDKKEVYKIFRDSNIGYGQLIIPDKLIKDNIEYKKPPDYPTEGNFWIPAEYANPCNSDDADQLPKWVMHFKPTGHYRYSILLFTISRRDITSMLSYPPGLSF